MDTDRLNRWLTLGANVGVLVGLFILVLEIQQNNRIGTATLEVAVREAFGSANESVYTNPETAALLAKAKTADAEFSDAEREMLDYYFGRHLNIYTGIEEAYANEMISKKTFDKALEDLQWTLNWYPGMRPIFEAYVEAYPSSADSEMIQAINRYLEEK